MDLHRVTMEFTTGDGEDYNRCVHTEETDSMERSLAYAIGKVIDDFRTPAFVAEMMDTLFFEGHKTVYDEEDEDENVVRKAENAFIAAAANFHLALEELQAQRQRQHDEN